MIRHLLGILLMTLLLSTSAPEARAQETEASCSAPSPIKQLRLQETSAAPATDNAFWELADGPYGGHIREVVTLADGTVLALGGPVFRSGDDGTTWDRVAGDARNLVLPPGDGGTAYYYRGNCLYVSRDSGLSWTSHCLDADSLGLGDAILLTIEDLAVTATGGLYVVVFALKDFECWYGTTSLWYSDNGEAWHRMEGRVADDTRLTVLGDTLLVRHSKHFLSTFDGDKTWQPLPRTPASVLDLSGHLRDTLLAGTSEGLYQLTDTSAGWVALDLEESTSGDQTVYDVEQLPDGRVCIAGPGVQCRQGDGPFEAVGSVQRMQHLLARPQSVAAGPGGDLLVGGYWRGVYRYAEGSWKRSVDGMRQDALHAIAEAPDGQLYGAVSGSPYFSDGNLYVSHDGGSSWKLRTHNLQGGTKALFVTAESVLLRATSREVYRSIDGGRTWSEVASPSRGIRGFVQRVDGSIIGVSEQEVYRSASSGKTWQQIGRLDTTAYRYPDVRDVAQGHDGTIYAATDYGMQRSIDGGASWETVLDAETAGTPDRADVAITSTGAIVAMYHRTVFRSSDGGTHWTSVRSFSWPTVLDPHVTTVAGRDSVVYASAGSHLWISTDDGQTWTKSDDGSSVGTIYSLHVTGDGYLLAGTGAAAHRSRRDTPTSTEEHAPVATHMQLTIAPNPVRRRATLRYHLTVPGEVRLTLYDVLGRHVRTLTAGRRNPGGYEVQLETSGLAPGTYFVRLETPEGVQAQALVVVR